MILRQALVPAVLLIALVFATARAQWVEFEDVTAQSLILTSVSLTDAQEKDIADKSEEIRKALAELEETFGELQRSDRLKMESLTVISNELATPIRKILNHTSKMVDTFSRPLRPEIVEPLNKIHDQAFFLKAISENINHLTEHFKTHKKDFAGRRGLLGMVGQRRNMLDYLRTLDIERYRAVIKALGLRK